MPICCKCGKFLTSEQSLKYHLNKKLPCDSHRLQCKCGKRFNTLLDTRLHSMHCQYPSNNLSSHVSGVYLV